MNVTINKNDAGKTVIETEDKQHTLLTLLRKYLWDSGVESGYDEGHPYLGGSNLVIESKNPEEDIKESFEEIRKDIEEFRDSFQE